MSFVQSITHRFPAFVRDPLISLIGQECYTTLVWNVDLTSTYCVKYSISKALGLGIVVGGSIVKVPQILKILKSGSVRGLSLSSYLLDTASLGITVIYNMRNRFPWSTYGENVFLLIQNIIITSLILHHASTSSRLTGFLALTAFAAFAFFNVSPSTLTWLAASAVPLSLSSKVPQIISNARLRSTGQLSAFLVFNSLAGCLARVFTTATETGDRILWLGFVGAAALNAVLAIQMAMYWDKSAASKDRLTSGSRSAAAVGGGQPELEKVQVSPSASSPSRRYVRKLD